MKIGDLSKQTGVSVTALRFYAEQGLLTYQRKPSGYRDFPSDSARQLRRIMNFRSLRLSLPEIKNLLILADTPRQSCSEVCALMETQLKNVIAQQSSLQELEQELRRLLAICKGPENGGCKILAELEG